MAFILAQSQCQERVLALGKKVRSAEKLLIIHHRRVSAQADIRLLGRDIFRNNTNTQLHQYSVKRSTQVPIKPIIRSSMRSYIEQNSGKQAYSARP